MMIHRLFAVALLLVAPCANSQTTKPAPQDSSSEARTLHASTIVVCAANTTETRGCSVTVTGTSDQKLINSAISDCSSSNGCRIVLRNGVYNISAPIIIDRSHVTLEGETWPFWGAYLRPWSGTSNPVSTVGTQGALIKASATGFNLIEIQHHNIPDTGERRHRGIRIANLYVVGKDYSNNCVDSLSDGNHQDDSGIFESLTLTRCAWGLYISVDNGYIDKNNMQDLVAGGAFVSGVNSRFIDNIVWDVGGRGLLAAVRGFVVSGNTFGDTASYSLDAQGPGVAVITGNQFGPTSATGAINLACSGCVVTGNYFDANTGSFKTQRRNSPVIRIANSAATNNVIVGNSFIPGGTEATGTYAVDVSDSRGNVVLGNSISAGFNNGSTRTIHAGIDNLVQLNKGDDTPAARIGQTINFQPGPLTAVTNTKGAFSRFVDNAVVDNIEVSAIAFKCTVNPKVTLYECGTSPSCVNPAAIGSATLTAAGQVADGTVSKADIDSGDYIAWALSGGTCSELNISASAQTHSR
jgi:hypothetical protein